MPLQGVEYDALAAMMSFKTSAVFEMLVSLQGTAEPWRAEEHIAQMTSSLGEDFVAEVGSFYRSFDTCCALSELAVDAPDYDDVESFFDYVLGLTQQRFAFYVLGRWFRVEEIPESVTRQRIRRLIEASPSAEEISQLYPGLEWAEDVPGLQKLVVEYWRKYWYGFLSRRIPDLRDRWSQSIASSQQYLRKNGGSDLLRKLTRHEKLPAPIPPEQPFTRVDVIPLCLSPQPRYIYFGYGSAQVLYDCNRSEDRENEIEADKSRSLSTLRALADESRLEILKLIAKNGRMLNGKKIAEKLALSPSVVSRHLSQLKESGLVAENPTDNRTISYRFNYDRLRDLGRELESFLKD